MAVKRDKFGNIIPLAQDDAFDRQRTSNPETLFEDKTGYSRNCVDTGIQNWIYVESGGTATYNGSDSTVDLVTDTTSGSRVVRQSRRYISYEPGKSQLVQLTGVAFSGSEAVFQAAGQFDDRNGVFFVSDSGGQWGVGVRTDIGSGPVDNITYQSSWNADRFDGSGKVGNESRIQLSPDKGHILVIDYQWLSLGTVRFGFMISGNLQWAHYANHANILDEPYMRTATLPIRYEIKNLATITNTPTLKSICATIASEGGHSAGGPSYLASNGATLRTGITTRRPILAVRLLNNYFNRNNRINAQFLSFQGYAEDQTCYVEVEHTTNVESFEGTWLPVDSNSSACEFSTDVTSVHGGRRHTISSTWVTAAKNSESVTSREVEVALEPFHFIVQNFDSTKSEMFVVYATSMVAQAAKMAATLEWQEIH